MDKKRVGFNLRGNFNGKSNDKYNYRPNDKFNGKSNEKSNNKSGLKNSFIGLFVLTIILIAFILFISISSASFDVGSQNYSISKVYGSGANISGWINISFEDEPMDSVFNSSFDGSFGNSITLGELINSSRNPAYNYTCVPANCKKDYAATGGGSSSIQKDLATNEDVIYGLKVTGDNFNAVRGFSFDISSNAPASEFQQLSIDILNDESSEWVPYVTSGSFNENNKNNGCYNSPATGSGIISSSSYSNLIRLAPSPNLKIGAVISRTPTASGNANFTMQITEVGTQRTGSCNINNIDFPSGEIECVPAASGKNFSVTKEGDFLVSIRATSGSQNKYRINYKIDEDCRGSNLGNFQIFAKKGLYAALGSYRINDTEIGRSIGTSSNIENKITNYIINRYGRNCGAEGCIVPIKFSSRSSQRVSILNIQLTYEWGSSPNIITEIAGQFYGLDEFAPKVNSGFQKLHLDKAGFTVPDELGDYTFSLSFGPDSEEILSEIIEIKNVPIINSLSPLSTASAYPTEFKVSVSSPADVSVVSYTWNFGDNTQPVTTTINKSSHTYSALGTYQIALTIRDSRGFSSSRTFDIVVNSAKNLINTTLNEMNADLANINAEIQTMEQPFYRTAFSNALSIKNSTNEIGNLTIRYNNPTNSEPDYNAILTSILRIKIPKTILKTEQGDNLLFLPEKDSVDMDVVKAAGSGNYSVSREDEYKDAVVLWQLENVDLFIDFAEFSGEFDSDLKPIAKIFEIKAVPKNSSLNYNYYIFVPESVSGNRGGFDRNVNRSQGFVYVNLKDNPNLGFYTTQDVNFEDIPLFISPSISKLSLGTGLAPPEKSKLYILILIMVGLLIVAFIVYLILQRWYKKKYEKFLFPNRNDLYNLAIYVNNMKKRGMSNSDIKEHLKKAGWDAEQVRYVMRKYEGKSTGMPEFPLKLAEEKKDEHKSHGVPGYESSGSSSHGFKKF